MRLSVALEHRFLRAPDGTVWTQTSFAWPFWQRYLEVFDDVRCLARVLPVSTIPAGWQRADGTGVTFDAVPYYRGPSEFLRRALAVRRAIRAGVDTGQAFILRVPGNVGTIASDSLLHRGHPFGVEVVADPYDVFSPGAITHPLRPFLRWRSTRRLRRLCAAACAASYVTERALQQRYPTGAPAVAASSAELGDDAFVARPRPLRPASPRLKLVTVGSLAYLLKAPDVLIRAVAECLAGGVEVELAVVGDGAQRPALEALARELGVADRVRFTGQLTAGAAVRDELDRADLFVLASRQEGLPRAMLEAMGRGLPCIGTTVGGIPELLPPPDLVPPGDVAALAVKIREVVGDPARRVAAGARNLARARDYHEDVLRPRRAAFYRRVREITESWLQRSAAGRPARLAYITTLPETQWAFLKGQNRYLRARGFEIHAVASPGSALARVAERDGALSTAVPISRTVSPVKDLVSLWRLFRTLRQVRPDIVHLSTPKAALLGAIAAWTARVPVRVFLMRGSITEAATGVRRALYRRLERITAALCHQTICVAPSLLAFLRTEGVLPAHRGLVLAHGMSNGIDAARFAPGDGRAEASPARDGYAPEPRALVVGFVGRLARDKGIEELVEGWATVRDAVPHARLLLVGPWEAENPIRQGHRELLERDPRVHLAGHVADVVPYYRAMSLLVFPSHGTEGFPNVPMEAAAVGLPVIATRVVGCVDAVQDGVTGTLVPPHDARALADAMRRYLDNAQLRQRHGAAGRARVLRDFAPEPIWRALLAEYLRLLHARGLPVPARAASAGAAPEVAAP